VNVKLFIIILITSLSFNGYSQFRDKALNKQFSDQTLLYKDSIKSVTPNKAVSFISSRINQNYYDLIEVDIDSSDVSDNEIRINRPLSSPKIKTITECLSEHGSATFSETEIIISTNRLPLKVKCVGNGGNYFEVYSTFEKNE